MAEENNKSEEIKKALSLGSVEKKAFIPESMAKPNESDAPIVTDRGADSPDELPNE